MAKIAGFLNQTFDVHGGVVAGAAKVSGQLVATPDPLPDQTTLVNYNMPSSDASKTFNNYLFNGDPAKTSTHNLLLAHTVNHVTFNNIEIGTYVYEGFVINDSGGNIHDIIVNGFHIDACNQAGVTGDGFGLEFTSRSAIQGYPGWNNIQLLNGLVEPARGEAMSVCDGDTCLIDTVVIKGAGNKVGAQYGQGLELYDITNVTVNNLTVYRCAGWGYNFNGKLLTNGTKVVPPAHAPACNWVFTDCVVDFRTSYLGAGIPTGAACMGATSIVNVVFDNCDFYCGGVTGGIYLYNCQNVDLSTSRVHGPAKSGMKTFSQDANCSGNKAPTILTS